MNASPKNNEVLGLLTNIAADSYRNISLNVSDITIVNNDYSGFVVDVHGQAYRIEIRYVASEIEVVKT